MVNETPVTIIDFVSGRGLGGHFEDYLHALEQVLAPLAPTFIAPFRDAEPVPAGRAGIYRFEFKHYRAAVRVKPGERRVVVIHSAEYSDYVALWAALRSLPRRRRATCLFILRRGPEAVSLAGHAGWQGELLIKLVTAMIRKRLIHPGFDSRVALQQWLARVPGASGELVASAPPPGVFEVPAQPMPAPAHPHFVIAGRMRPEKGAANYPATIAALLAEAPAGHVTVQTVGESEAARTIARELEQRFAADERVTLLGDHLSGAEYLALLQSSDVVVLPYDIAGYGSGTSGVLADGLALGKVVIVPPIEWAADFFAGNEKVVWLDDPSVDASLRRATAAALQAMEAGGGLDFDPVERFRESWFAAIRGAVSSAGAGRTAR